MLDSTIYREWNKELEGMVQVFRDMAVTQASRYIELDLKDWVAKVRSMNTYVSMAYTHSYRKRLHIRGICSDNCVLS